MRKKVRKAIGEETMRFLRGNYALDEVGNDRDEVAFRDGDETLLTIFIRKRSYDFQIGAQAVRVTDMKSLEEAKKLILAAKEPNRRPFPKENAVYAKCGHRCDLCVHYAGGSNSDEFRALLKKHIVRVYGWDTDGAVPPCLGCAHGGLDGKSDCPQMKCAAKKGVARCQDCGEYNGCQPAICSRGDIAPRSFSAGDVSWAILPFAHEQYGN